MEIEELSEKYELGVKRSFRRSDNFSDQPVTVTTHIFVEKRTALFMGVSTGVIMVWKHKSEFDKKIQKSELKGHKGPVYQFLFLESIGPGLLLSCSADRTIKVWDVFARDSKRVCVQTITGHGGSVTGMASVGDYLVTTSTDGNVKIWKGDSGGRELLLYPWFKCVQTISDGVIPCCVASVVRADEAAFLVGDDKGRLRFYSPPYPQKGNNHFALSRPPTKLHSLGIANITVLQGETTVVTMSFDYTVQMFDALTGSEIFRATNPAQCRYTGCAWHGARQELYLVDQRGFLQVWSVHEEKVTKSRQLTLNGGPLMGITRMLGAGGQEKVLVAADDGVFAWKIARDLRYQSFKGHEGAVLQLTYIDNENSIFSAALDNTLRCWDQYDMRCLGIIREPESEICCIVYIPGSVILASGHDNGAVKLWNVDNASCMLLEHHDSTVACLAVAHAPETGRDLLLAGSYDGKVSIWDVSKKKAFSPEPHKVLQVAEEEVYAILCCNVTGTFYTAGEDGKVQGWCLSTWEKQGECVGHKGAVTALAKDGNFLFSASDDLTIKVWDASCYFHVATLKGHTQAVKDLCMTDLGMLISCGEDGKVLVWDYISQAIKAKFEQNLSMRCLLYNAKNKLIYVGTDEDVIITFQISREFVSWGNVNRENVGAEMAQVLENFSAEEANLAQADATDAQAGATEIAAGGANSLTTDDKPAADAPSSAAAEGGALSAARTKIKMLQTN